MDHRIDKLSTLLDTNETQLNVSNLSEISFKRENSINESTENYPCSSTINVKPLLITKSKINSSCEKLKCETTKLANSTELNIHTRIHSKQKPYSCDHCQMNFSIKGNLTSHKRTHTGERPYSCCFCPKKFARSDCLIVHKRIHTGEKPYQCDICHIKFSCLSSLTYHKRIHRGEKPYDCDSCHKKFSQSTSLIRHQRVHTEKRPAILVK
jgi:KRAB domain-containing zinc finger protein